MDTSVGALVEKVAETGYTVTEQQIQRWHRHGLLPRPTAKGQGRGRGVVYLYPDGTFAQLLDVLRLRSESKSLSDIRWSLWWKGYAIEFDLIKGDLRHEVEQYRAFLENVIGPTGGLSDGMREELESHTRVRLPKSLSMVSRRVGQDRWIDLLDGLISTLCSDGELSADSVKLVEHGLGFDRAMSDKINGVSWLNQGIEAIITPVRNLLKPDNLRDAVESLTPELLERNKQRVQLFTDLLLAMSRFTAMFLNRWDFALGAWGSLFENVMNTPDGQRTLTVLFAGIDRVLPEGTTEAALETLGRLSSIRDTIGAATRSAEENPLLRTTATPQRVKTAINDPKKREKLQRDVGQTDADRTNRRG